MARFATMSADLPTRHGGPEARVRSLRGPVPRPGPGEGVQVAPPGARINRSIVLAKANPASSALTPPEPAP